MTLKETTGSVASRLGGRGISSFLALGIVLCAGVARGDGVADTLVSVSLPPATIAVIDPESGTSGGGGTTDVRLGVGDVILFRLNYFPLPDQQIRGLAGYLTEYIPANTEVVGIRLIDPNGLTVLPSHPGIANDGCARACSGFNAVLCNPALAAICTAGGTRNLDDGTISELHSDTGIFFSSAASVGRNPTTAFLSYTNGVLMNPAGTMASNIAPILNISAPFYAHDDWDYWQVRGLGISNPAGNSSGNNGTGNTPFGYGSAVAGPDTGYRYEVTLRGGRYEFNDVVGPWSRARSPGSLIGVGAAATGTGTLRRMIADASVLGTDVTPAAPLPTTTRAVRAALGEMRPGEFGALEIALRVRGTPIDPAFGRDADCGEIFGADTSGRSDTGRARDNLWPLFIPSPACVFLNLLFDLTVDDALATTGDTLNYSLHGRNLSTNPQTGVTVTQKYDSTRVSFVSATGTYTLISNCDGDGLSCIRWTLGTLAPSADYILNSVFTVGGGGQVTNVMRAVYRSTELPGGFATQAVNLVRAVPVLRATATPTAAFASAGGSAAWSGELRNDGSGDMGVDSLTFVLPGAAWRATGSITVSGVGTFTCSSGCATSTPTYSGLGFNIIAGQVRTVSGTFSVPAGTATAIHDVDFQVWGSTMAFGGNFETYFPDVLRIPVGAPRSAIPTLDCPILSSASRIRGSTSEADGTDVRAYFSLTQRGIDLNATAGRFDVTGFVPTFGPLYGGLEVRATAQAPGELESELSVPCYVTFVSQCQDGIDNDGDSLVDFPADPGCAGPTDGDETDVQCSNSLDDDTDTFTDFPADPECTSLDDTTEGGTPACMNGIDDDGDGLVDFPADPGCTAAGDRTEVTRRACMDGIDNDGDGRIDFGLDPGCHSSNDSSESDFSYAPGDIRARILLVFDTSGSMSGNVCAGAFTGGDGSFACGGADVSCATCSASGCGNGIADDSRIARARVGVSDVVAGYGEVEYSLMRYHQRPVDFTCPGTNASLRSGGWQGGGASPCGGGFSAGDLLVGFSPENSLDLLEWMDGRTNYTGTAPAGLDIELRGSGTTPIAGALSSARTALLAARTTDPVGACRPYRVILLTDGLETCGGDPVAAATALSASGFPTNVIGFAVASPSLDAIAAAGGTGAAIFADDSTQLSTAIASIVNSAILREVCNNLDDDCDTLIDEGFVRFCDRPGGVATATLCTDPGERVCDGIDDNCNGVIDEGVRNACGTCGALPVEVCNRIDDDCDGLIDEGGVCAMCSPQPETCNGADDDCDTRVDEGITRACGTDVGVCTSGIETCVAGVFGACTGVGPSAETCNNLDDDCDGVIDGQTRPCGSAVGACVPGVERCTAGAFGTCIGGLGPTTEICNAIDDDCDGSTDEGNPGGGATCGSSAGICLPGAITCVGGALTCVGGTSPAMETCDLRDEDCDGLVDESVPPGAVCGACGDGLLRCVAGSMTCTGDRTPSTEVCNAIDDDCDVLVDEGNPGGGAVCGDDTGECAAGLFECRMGRLDCVGAVGPTPEVCNALDDDCDGVIDDGLPVGAPCGTDTGECTPGRFICTGGAIMCDGAIGPGIETCNGLDDDCDAMTDEALPSGGVCGDTTGVCMPGLLQCVSGAEICVGGVPTRPETCDCSDEDCDGAIDENPGTLCPPGASCTEFCTCALPCDPLSEFGMCPFGTVPETTAGGECVCIPPRCTEDVCGARTISVGGVVQCAPDAPGAPVCACDGADCTFPCDGVLCTSPTICRPSDGRCVMDNCFGLGCPAGELCDETLLTCEPDACLTAACASDDACRLGVCEPSCASAGCAAGERCRAGVCETDACAGVSCGAGELCDPADGMCTADLCVGVTCTGRDTRCEPLTGECHLDPCLALHCPGDEVCRAGECEGPPITMADAGIPDSGMTVRMDAGVDGGVAPPIDPERRVLGAGGACSCRAAGVPVGGRAPIFVLLILGLSMFVRRGRS